MRIRKNRTSSRMIPEFCVTHIVEKAENIKRVDSSNVLPPPLQRSIGIGNRPVEIDEPELDVTTIQKSLDSGGSAIKIRDFVLAQGENARSGGSKKHMYNGSSQNRQSGSESDTGYAVVSTKRTEKGHGDEKQPKSTLSSSYKTNSSASSKLVGEKSELTQEETFAESEVIDNPRPKLTTTRILSTGSSRARILDTGRGRIEVGSRKRHRNKMESDSGLAQEKGTAKTKSDSEDCAGPSAAADPEAAEGKLADSREHQGKGSAEIAPASSFPAGWSYRGLAQIAEHDKTTQGKQCGRTDGRSWRCPLKVRDGFTLCEHHLSKFRLKKLGKGKKKHKSSAPQFRPQLQQQIQLQHDGKQRFEELNTTNSTHLSAQNEIPEAAQTPATAECDVPMKFRRRHKTVKLSVL